MLWAIHSPDDGWLWDEHPDRGYICGEKMPYALAFREKEYATEVWADAVCVYNGYPHADLIPLYTQAEVDAKERAAFMAGITSGVIDWAAGEAEKQWQKYKEANP